MKRWVKVALGVIGMLAVAYGAAADDGVRVVRPVHAAWQVEVGSSHVGDSYLSPLKYVGWHAGLQYDRLQAMKFDPDGWRQQLRISVLADKGMNPAGNNSMLYGSVGAQWGMMHVWRLPFGVKVAGGGVAGGNVGCVYNGRNSNNPASVKADATLGVTGYATWSVKLWRLPVMLRWQTTLPLVGAFFSPDYDELYYEIYLGNRSGLAHVAWPGNFFRWDNEVTADLDVSYARLRVGFSSRIFSTEVSGLTTRIFSYGFVLGVSGDWMSVSAARGVSGETERIVYAY